MPNLPPLQKTRLQIFAAERELARVANGSPQGDNSTDMAEVYFFTEAEKLLSTLDLLGIEDFRGEQVCNKRALFNHTLGIS